MSKKSILLVLALVAAAVIAGLVYWYLGGGSSSMTNGDMLESDQPLYETVSEEVNYYDGARGYFARPMPAGSYPGVVMVHEWWGLNDNIRQMADELAGQGYAVLAVDLYNGEVAESAEQARTLVTSLDQDAATANMQAATDFLRERDAQRVASLGWCFGGGQSLQLALSGEQLDATVIYYGSLVTDRAQLDDIAWPVLGIFGEEDQSISVDDVNTFDTVLDEAGVEHSIHIYPGVGHAFANPSGSNYAATETQDAWRKTLDFLNANLKQ